MKTETKYDVNYFIRKFENLKSEDIGSGSLNNHCVLYHCGCRNSNKYAYSKTKESAALVKLMGGRRDTDYIIVFGINDGLDRRFKQESPKQRILAALYDIKESQEKPVEQVKTEYILVQVDSKVKDLAKEELIMN